MAANRLALRLFLISYLYTMNQYNEPLYKIFIRKLPDPAALPGEVFPFFFDIILNRAKERRQMTLFLGRLKSYQYSINAVHKILFDYLNERVHESEIEFSVMEYHPKMRTDLIEYDIPGAIPQGSSWWDNIRPGGLACPN